METVMEKRESIVETPSVEVATRLGRVGCTYLNTLLVRSDTLENHIEFTEGDTEQLTVAEADWETLLSLDFPWEYRPDLSQFDYNDDFIFVKYDTSGYYWRPQNTTMKLYKDKKFNHIEHHLDNQVRGMFAADELWRKLFEDGYPIKYSPYVDPVTQQWYDSLGKKRS